jgi:hypothetical protein
MLDCVSLQRHMLQRDTQKDDLVNSAIPTVVNYALTPQPTQYIFQKTPGFNMEEI